MPTFLPISEAADFLGVSPKTLRRWEDSGRISPTRTNGNQRRYAFEDLQPIKEQLSSKSGTQDNHPEVKIALEKLESLDSKLDKIEDKIDQNASVTRSALVNSHPQRSEEAIGSRSEHNPPAVPLAVVSPSNPPPPPPGGTLSEVEGAVVPPPHHKSRFSPASALIALLLFLLLGTGAYASFNPQEFQRYVLAPLASSLLTGGAQVEGAARFLSDVFFGETDSYFISPLGDASFRTVSSQKSVASSLGAGTITASTITTDYLTVTRSETIAGLNADFLDGQDGSYYLSWENTTGKPLVLSSVEGVSNNEGNIDLVASGNITITANDSSNTITFTVPAPAQGSGSGLNADLLDSLDSIQFLRSDVSDSFTSGTLTLASGATLDIAGSFTCTDCLGASQIQDIYLFNTGDTATGDYTFDTNTLFVDSVNNRVGIGTTSPNNSLEVVRSAVDSQSVAYFNGSDVNNYGLKVNIANTTANRTVLDLQSSGTSKAAVFGSGGVVIGSGAPILTDPGVNGLALGGIGQAGKLRIYNSTAGAQSYAQFDSDAGSTAGRLNIRGGQGTGSLVNEVALYSNLLFGTDNSFDIGASGETRPRSIYWGTTLTGPGTAIATTGDIRLATAKAIGFRNATNTANYSLYSDAGASRLNFSSDDGTTVPFYIESTGSIAAGGTNAATTGAIRLPNATSIGWRNAANSANVRFAFSDKWEFHRALDDLSIINIYTGESGSTGVGIDIQADASAGFYKLRSSGGVNRWEITAESGMTVGAPTGGLKGIGTINVATNIFKNDSAYTNPDYAFEHYFTGSIVKFAGNEGASDYPGLLPLSQVEEFAKQNYELPRVGDKKGIFDRADILLEKMEEVYLYLFGHEKRISKLEEGITVDSDGDLAKEKEDGSSGKIVATIVEADSGVFQTLTSTVEAIFDHVKAQTLDVAGKLTAKTAEITEAVIDRLIVRAARVNELEMVDKATGEIYCTWIENGDWQKTQGPCQP